ncbi:MAG: hypothetical protein P4M11_13985 [Candidatus Pacebacteria bacterium]|nr:hypothetical protein [Candidatus Paceibacterota bacterium]
MGDINSLLATTLGECIKATKLSVISTRDYCQMAQFWGRYLPLLGVDLQFAPEPMLGQLHELHTSHFL